MRLKNFAYHAILYLLRGCWLSVPKQGLNRFLASRGYNRHALSSKLLYLHLILDLTPSPHTWGSVHRTTAVGAEEMTIGLNQQQATGANRPTRNTGWHLTMNFLVFLFWFLEKEKRWNFLSSSNPASHKAEREHGFADRCKPILGTSRWASL